MKTKTDKFVVMYFDLFEPKSFADAVYDAAGHLPLLRRLFVAGMADSMAKSHPDVIEKNKVYTVEVRIKHLFSIGTVYIQQGIID